MDLTFTNLPEVLAEVAKNLSAIEVDDCGENLVAIDASIARYEPHAYASLAAPYGYSSPYTLRISAADRLFSIDQQLAEIGLGLKVFDGYRPLAVQHFMVDKTFREYRLLKRFIGLSDHEVYKEVFKLWARPNNDPKLPPPHSTAGAVDVTLIRRVCGSELPMGSKIDEAGEVQLPNFFADRNTEFHDNRQLLRKYMLGGGFAPLIHEWWHFSYGDQRWALWVSQHLGRPERAIYGRFDLAELLS